MRRRERTLSLFDRCGVCSCERPRRDVRGRRGPVQLRARLRRPDVWPGRMPRLVRDLSEWHVVQHVGRVRHDVHVRDPRLWCEQLRRRLVWHMRERRGVQRIGPVRDHTVARVHRADQLRRVYAVERLRLVRREQPLPVGHTERAHVGKLLGIVGVAFHGMRRDDVLVQRALVRNQQLRNGFVRYVRGWHLV